MAFGDNSGPPASPKQLSYLKSLLKAAGHDDFRSARREYGLTQRQAGGKFSSREASALIDRLTGNEPSEPPPVLGRGEVAPPPIDASDPRAHLLRGLPASLLADELERRGWTVSPPD
jgi:hypothetical protein